MCHSGEAEVVAFARVEGDQSRATPFEGSGEAAEGTAHKRPFGATRPSGGLEAVTRAAGGTLGHEGPLWLEGALHPGECLSTGTIRERTGGLCFAFVFFEVI